MQSFKYSFSIFYSIVLLLISCSNVERKEVDGTLTDTSHFQQLIDSVVIHNDTVAGVLLHIESSAKNVSWNGVSGFVDIDKNSKLVANQPFRIASVTKTYVATAILRLYEDNKLSLDDTIGRFISKDHLKLLKKDSYETNKITIRHLLNHTSGLFDYAMTDEYFNSIYDDPNHFWTRDEQLELTIRVGGSVGKPGEQFNYSDTGYILLGEILENITGKQLGESLREIIGFEQLGLRSTWLESYEERPEGLPDIVHPYFDGKDFYSVSPSIDLHGGGGLVSTVSDVALFFQALFEYRIFKKNSTLDIMKTVPQFPEGYYPRIEYGMGLMVIKVDGVKIYYHAGFWNTLAVYIPELKTAMAINYTYGYDPNLFVEAISLLKSPDK